MRRTDEHSSWGVGRGAAQALVVAVTLAWELVAGASGSTSTVNSSSEKPVAVLERIEGAPGEGFHWPYFLYVPKTSRPPSRILVLPNNSGELADELAVHEKDAEAKTKAMIPIAESNGWVLLRPIFPRPARLPEVYTHALDRDALAAKDLELARLDRQLGAMIDHARTRLKNRDIPTEAKVLMLGFSASGSFVDRFILLQPERVEAAAIGSPGGWATVPLASSNGTPLTYPLGVADLRELAGRPFNAQAYRRVRQLFFMGTADDNEMSYDPVDRPFLLKAGPTRLARWPLNTKLLVEGGCNCTFRLHEGIGHTVSKEMLDEASAFLRSVR